MLGRRPAAILLAGLASLPGRALGQAFTVQPTANVVAGYTLSRTIGQYPDDDPCAQSGPQITPSLSLATTYETPWSVNKATLLASGLIPFTNSFALAPRRFSIHLQLNGTSTRDLTPLTNL